MSPLVGLSPYHTAPLSEYGDISHKKFQPLWSKPQWNGACGPRSLDTCVSLHGLNVLMNLGHQRVEIQMAWVVQRMRLSEVQRETVKLSRT